MAAPQYTLDEIGRIAEEVYRRDIRDKVLPQHKGKFLVLDIKSGDFEVNEDDLKAEEILRARQPDSVFYLMRIGYTTAYTLAGTRIEEARWSAS